MRSKTIAEAIMKEFDLHMPLEELDKASEKAAIDTSRNYSMHNDLVISIENKPMSLLAQKILRLAICEIDSINDENFNIVKYPLKELSQRLGIESNAYRDLKKAVLFSMSGIEVNIFSKEFYKSESETGQGIAIPLFHTRAYNNGCIYLEFDERLKPFLLQLKKNFSQIPISNVLHMEYTHSIRIYELFMAEVRGKKIYGDKVQEIEVSLKTLKEITGTTEKYTTADNFKRVVLKPALKDIEKNANIHCEFKSIHTGRYVTGFKIRLETVSNWKMRTGKIKRITF